MIKSMTGYGSASGSCEGLAMTVELRSVNNRYMDCSIRLPRNFAFAEESIKSKVQEHISRGKVDVFVTVDSTAASDIVVALNESLARGYVDSISRISETFGLKNDLTALSVGRFPDVLCVEKKEADKETIGKALGDIAGEALKGFDEMRCREGQKMTDDISGRLDTIESMVAEVERRSPETVADYRERLYRKMKEILDSTGIDEQRILTEAAIYSDKVAVDEETVRLRSHISQMRGMLKTGSPIGRKMDFLIQEFNRETNTIGSKCGDSAVTKVVIEIKSEIEKIREQIQNIE